MQTIPSKRYTEEEYLELERGFELRHEYFAGKVVPFARNSYKHSRIKNNVSFRIDNGRPDCYVMTSTMRTLAGKSFFYPDVVVVKGEPETRADGFDDILLNPTIVIEVVSPETASDDQSIKFINYARIPSLMDYILVWQDELRVLHYKGLEDGEWPRSRAFTQLGDVLEIESISHRLTLAEIYDRIQFDR